MIASRSECIAQRVAMLLLGIFFGHRAGVYAKHFVGVACAGERVEHEYTTYAGCECRVCILLKHKRCWKQHHRDQKTEDALRCILIGLKHHVPKSRWLWELSKLRSFMYLQVEMSNQLYWVVNLGFIKGSTPKVKVCDVSLRRDTARGYNEFFKNLSRWSGQ